MKKLSIFKIILSSLQQIELNAINENIFYKIINKFFVESVFVIVFDKIFNIVKKLSRFIVAADIIKSLNIIVLKNKS